MQEAYLSIGESTLYCRHNDPEPGRPSLLFLHGLGDSGGAFQEAFEDPRLDGFNLVAPDLLGYGRSSRAPDRDYPFQRHLDCVEEVVRHFGLRHITLVGHSMGGDLGTRLSGPECNLGIERFINVEGNLTEEDLFISGAAVGSGESFGEWFRWRFRYRRVYGDWCKRWPFGRRYLAALHLCDPEAFRQNAEELVGPFRDGTSRDAGERYCELGIEKLFVFGQKSLHPASRRFLCSHELDAYEVEGSHHWPMIEAPDELYSLIHRFCSGRPEGLRVDREGGDRQGPERRVPQVRVPEVAEYEDLAVQRTLDSTNAPLPIRRAREIQDRILRERYEGVPVRIADIGCGDGYHLETFGPRCELYHGFEVSSKMVEAATERVRSLGLGNVEIFHGDVGEAELTVSYDVAWCLYFTAGNLRERREYLTEYDEGYLERNPALVDVASKFFSALVPGGSLFLTVYKDTPEAEAAQHALYWRTGQIVLTDVGADFVATDKGFWSFRWTEERLLRHLGAAGVPREDVTLHELGPIAWLVEARKKARREPSP